MKRSFSVVCAGIGGRGVLLASTLLMDSAQAAGVYSIGSDEYGMAQRGGAVISLVKLGNVKSPLIGSGSCDLLLAFEESEFFRNLDFLKPGGISIVNTEKKSLPSILKDSLREFRIRTYLFDADGVARKEGLYQASNMAMLGFLSGLRIWPFTYENLKFAINQRLKGKMLEANLRVFEMGFESFKEEGL